MPEFLNAIFGGALVGIIFWVIKKVHDHIEEIFSRLEDCEEILSQLKK